MRPPCPPADELDALARRLARGAIDGELPVEQVREQFAGIIFQAQVAADVARRFRFSVSSDSEEIELVLHQRLTEKALSTRGEAADLNLDRIASGASTLGWARQLGYKVALSKARDLRAAAAHVTALPDPHNGVALAQMVDARDVLTLAGEDMIQCALSAVESANAARHTGQICRTSARALRLAYDLPRTVGDESLLVNYLMRQALQDEPSVALESLRTRHSRAPNRLLSPLWDLYSGTHCDVVEQLTAEHGHQAAYLLAMEAVAAGERPTKAGAATVKEHLRGWNTVVGWGQSVSVLVDAYLAVATEPVTGSARPGRQFGDVGQVRHRLALDWPNVVCAHLSAFPTSPIGANATQIADRLSALVDVVLSAPDRLTLPAPSTEQETAA